MLCIFVFVYKYEPLNEVASTSSSMTLADLLNLLSFFMQAVTKESIAYDLNGDGIITTTDLILLLGQMG